MDINAHVITKNDLNTYFKNGYVVDDLWYNDFKYSDGRVYGYAYDSDGQRHNLNLRGYNIPKTKDCYFVRATIRHCRFNGGWGKGTFYHEYWHSQGYDHPDAYFYELKGGRYGSYFIHSKLYNEYNINFWNVKEQF